MLMRNVAGVAEHGPLLRPIKSHQAAPAVQGVGGQTDERVLGPGRQGHQRVEVFSKVLTSSAVGARRGSGDITNV